MPRNVRNFWIEANIDGRESILIGGPRAKDGGIKLTIYQRQNGTIITATTITGEVKGDGTLLLDISSEVGQVEFTFPDDNGYSTKHIKVKTKR